MKRHAGGGSSRGLRVLSGAAVAGVALLVLFAGPFTGLVVASPAPGTVAVVADGSSGPSWAYGGRLWVNVTGSTDALNGTASYSIHAFLGLQVLLHQTNTSATTFELTANRTMASDVFADYCRPSCSAPTATANLSFRASEIADASANFTTTATVLGPNGTVPALGLVNSSTRTRAGLADSEMVQLIGPLATHTGTTSLTVHATSDALLSFGPALGLVPDLLSAASSWSSVSNFTGAGSWTVSTVLNRTPILGDPSSVPSSFSGTVNRTGTVGVVGHTDGSIGLRSGARASVIDLLVNGPFDVREGFFLVPAKSDLFGPSTAWGANETGQATTSTAAVDFGTSGGQPILLASATSYAGSSASASTADIAGPSGLVTSVQPANTATAGTLQAQPESYAAGQANSACLIGGPCAGTSGSTHGLGGVIVLAIAVVGLSVLVVGLVAARQPPRKEPTTPYAPLYPPGNGGPAAPPGRPLTQPPRAEDDPLGHLW